MRSDIHAVQLTATGTARAGPARVCGIYYVAAATAGTITVRDGGASGSTELILGTPALATAVQYIDLNGMGIRCETDIHVTLANVTSVTVFYDG